MSYEVFLGTWILNDSKGKSPLIDFTTMKISGGEIWFDVEFSGSGDVYYPKLEGQLSAPPNGGEIWVRGVKIVNHQWISVFYRIFYNGQPNELSVVEGSDDIRQPTYFTKRVTKQNKRPKYRTTKNLSKISKPI